MKPTLIIRILQVVGLALAGVLAFVLLVVLVFSVSGGLQTAVARKVIRNLDETAEITSFKSGFSGAKIQGFAFQSPEGLAITLQNADVRISVWRLLSRKEIFISKFLIEGLEVDLSQTEEAPVDSSEEPTQPATPDEETPATSVTLPSIWVENLDIDARIILTADQQVELTAEGGGLAPQATGKITFNVELHDAAAEGSLRNLAFQGDIEIGQPSPSALATRILLKEGSASADAEPMLTFEADYDHATNALEGGWEVSLDTPSLAPYFGDITLPPFTATVNGDYRFSLINEKGTLRNTLDCNVTDLSAFISEGTLTSLEINSEIDVAFTKDSLSLKTFETQIKDNRGKSVFSLKNLKTFEFPFGGDPADLSQFAGDAMQLKIQQFPLDWVATLTPDLTIQVEPLSADFVIAVEPPNSFRLKPGRSLSVQDLSLSQNGEPILSSVSFRVQPRFSYDASVQKVTGALEGLRIESPDGSIAEAVMSFTLDLSSENGNGASIFKIETFQSAVYLPQLFRQPVLANNLASLKSGELTINGTATVGGELQADFALDLTDLEAVADSSVGVKDFSIRLSAQQNLAGTLNAEVPVTLTGTRGTSRITTTAQYQADQTFEVTTQGETLFVEDFMSLVAAFTPPSSPEDEESEADEDDPEVDLSKPDSEPPWKGFSGKVDVTIEKIVFPQDYALKDVKAQVSVDSALLPIQTIQAQLDESLFEFSTDLAFRGDNTELPYALDSKLSLNDFDIGAYLKKIRPDTPPELETIIDVNGAFTSESPNLPSLPEKAKGTFVFKGSEGVLRPPIKEIPLVSGTGNTASKVNAIARLFGKEVEQVNILEQTLAYFEEIPFASLSIQVERDDDCSMKKALFLAFAFWHNLVALCLSFLMV